MAAHPDKHIYNPSGCIRLESLQKYMKGGFSEETRKKISMHLEECLFCKEAMEGLTLISDPAVQNKSIRTIREGMKGRIRRRKMSTDRRYQLKRRFSWVAAAASIVLLTGIFSVYNYLLKPDREYLAEEVNAADVSKNIPDSILERVIIEDKKDVLAVQGSSPEKMESPDLESKKIPGEKGSTEIVLSDMELEEELLSDSTPASFVSKDLVSSPVAEVIVVENEMDVLAMTEESKEISSERVEVGGVSAQKVAQTAVNQTDLEYAAVSSKKSKSATEPGANISLTRKISLTKPIFQDNEYNNFKDYITKNLIYPDSALKVNLPGRVILEFTIDENGIISELKVRESSHNIFEQEARRLILSSGIWQPATENGQPVSYHMFLPIDFIPPYKK